MGQCPWPLKTHGQRAPGPPGEAKGRNRISSGPRQPLTCHSAPTAPLLFWSVWRLSHPEEPVTEEESQTATVPSEDSIAGMAWPVRCPSGSTPEGHWTPCLVETAWFLNLECLQPGNRPLGRKRCIRRPTPGKGDAGCSLVMGMPLGPVGQQQRTCWSLQSNRPCPLPSRATLSQPLPQARDLCASSRLTHCALHSLNFDGL